MVFCAKAEGPACHGAARISDDVLRFQEGESSVKSKTSKRPVDFFPSLKSSCPGSKEGARAGPAAKERALPRCFSERSKRVEARARRSLPERGEALRADAGAEAGAV